MKKFLGITIFCLIFIGNAYAAIYKAGQEVEGQLVFSKKVKIDLPEGKWTIAARSFWNWHGLNLESYDLVKTENNEVLEGISISEFKLAGIVEARINTALYEILFKGKYDGCYERPEYFLLKYYLKGSSHNCLWVFHTDVDKALNYPDDPELKGANRLLKKWLKDNSIKLPKIMLSSDHSYFSRLTGGTWYTIGYSVNPKLLNAPKNNYFTEESSEYHKLNIKNFPKHNKIMQKWISISAERHKSFEKNVNAKNSHKLDLEMYLPSEIKNNQVKSNEVLTQLKKLNDLYKEGVLTKEEFEKAKKKILD